MIEARGQEQAAVLEGMRAALLAVPEVAEPVYGCSLCSDSGWMTRTDEKGSQFARRCVCQRPTPERRMAKLGVPARNLGCTLDSLVLAGADPSVCGAAFVARNFAREYPLGASGRGLLLRGPCGTGKTHLAVALLRELVLTRGVSGRFLDFRELFARLKRTYGREATEDESEVLDDVFGAEVLVLDELGAARQTEWSFDICEAVIDLLYRRNGTVILTTNLPNLPPEGLPAGRGDTLGDRIGMRAWSRLQEMCRVLEMGGADYRVRRAGKAQRIK